MSLKTLAILLSTLSIALLVIFSLPSIASVNGAFFAIYLFYASLVVWLIVLVRWLRKP